MGKRSRSLNAGTCRASADKFRPKREILKAALCCQSSELPEGVYEKYPNHRRCGQCDLQSFPAGRRRVCGNLSRWSRNDLGRRCNRVAHGSSFSQIGASGKPGSLHVHGVRGRRQIRFHRIHPHRDRQSEQRQPRSMARLGARAYSGSSRQSHRRTVTVALSGYDPCC